MLSIKRYKPNRKILEKLYKFYRNHNITEANELINKVFPLSNKIKEKILCEFISGYVNKDMKYNLFQIINNFIEKGFEFNDYFIYISFVLGLNLLEVILQNQKKEKNYNLTKTIGFILRHNYLDSLNILLKYNINLNTASFIRNAYKNKNIEAIKFSLDNKINIKYFCLSKNLYYLTHFTFISFGFPLISLDILNYLIKKINLTESVTIQ